MSPAQTPPSRRLLLWLGSLIVLILGYVVLRIIFPAPSPQMSTQATVEGLMVPNAPTPAVTDYVSEQKNFQYLVSYTDGGFSPATLHMKKGETVRFTNNASDTLKLTIATGTPQTLGRGAYVQYTASDVGTVMYADGTSSGALVVTQ